MNRIFWKRLIGSLFVAFGSLQLTRLVFFLNLNDYFEASSFDVVQAFLFGFEFDAVSIAYLLGLYFVALPFLENGKPQKTAKWYFLIMLGAMNFLNCADAEFFKFTSRRSTSDLFEFAFLSNDIFNLAPNLLSTFWYLVAAFGVIATLSVMTINRILQPSVNSTPLSIWQKIGGLSFTAMMLVIGARGGFHPIPLSIIDASKTPAPHLNAVVLSTPFTILKTLGKSELASIDFPENDLVSIDPIIEPGPSDFFAKYRNSNVVLLIVESLGKEYIGSLNGLPVGYTPFVDSLCKESMVFENAFANGHRSIEGISAIVASIPTLMYEPYTTSRYASNSINSLANLLTPEGYYTSFIHGGNKNSMNFDSFSKQAGYEVFYDRDDYPLPDQHYDGIWGISDHFMLNHCVDLYSDYKKPFFSTVFTLSSHHPYTIPLEFQNRFPKGTLPIHESIGYTDESLRLFFNKASKTEWYNNTLFVITADHTSLSEHPQYQSKTGSLKVPIIFYHPADGFLKGTVSETVQQVDIMPSVLELLGYDKPYFSFGKSVFDESALHTAIAFKHDQYQIFMDSVLVGMDMGEVNFIYRPEEDHHLHRNLIVDPETDVSLHLAYLKNYLRNYAIALQENRMTFETWSEHQQ